MANIININDFNSKELDYYARYKEMELLRINEPDPGFFIAESPNVIIRGLDAGYEPVSLLIEEKLIQQEAKTIIDRMKDVPVFTAKLDILCKTTGFNLTKGALCVMKRKKLPTLEEVCKNANRIAILEGVVNPTNVGAIFRSAAALNMDSVILSPACCDPLYRRSLRVSMGTVFQIPWTYAFKKESQWLDKGIATIKELGFKTAAMALDNNSVSIDNEKLMSEEKLAVILGTEGEGLHQSTIKESDYTVMIPMGHGVDSLNVAAASAVAFWQLSRH